jgi:hypothetical protein
LPAASMVSACQGLHLLLLLLLLSKESCLMPLISLPILC